MPASLMVEKQTVKGLVVNHLAESYLMAPAEDYAAVRPSNKSKTATQCDNLTSFDAAAALDAIKQALQSDDWRELAAGLIMAVQSRPSDMLKSGEFKAVSKYRLEFKSRAKKRGAVATGEIFCLVDAAVFVDAFSRLRREPDVMEMRGWALKDIDSGKNKTLNRAVNRIYGEIIPQPYGEDNKGELSCKNLRAAGVNVAYWLHGQDTQSLGRFAELQLLHDNPGTAANYEDFYAANADGNRLLKVGILKDEKLAAKPKSEKRSSVSVDAQLRDMIGDAEQWGEGSHADRLERIIARALQADRLERQLARECEKRQKAELDLKRLQESADTEPEPKRRKMTPEGVFHADDINFQGQRFKDNSYDAANGFDWRSVPNAELNGDRRHDAYAEKLRRTVEAVQDYNAGLEHSEHFSITGSLLRQITGVKPRLVKEWMTKNKAALDSYNSDYGWRQNVGKPNPRSVIKWSEVAYGVYKW